MRFADMHPRPVGVGMGTCAQCGAQTIVAYHIMVDKYFCSHECARVAQGEPPPRLTTDASHT